MKNLVLLAVAALILGSCQREESLEASSFELQATEADYTAASVLPVTTVSGEINTNTTWDNDHVWEISGVVRVTSGAILTIEPGTFIKADPNAAAPTGVLVVTKTGQVDATGTATEPIVFTSFRLLDGIVGNIPEPGDFGGVVLLGDASVNTGATDNVIEGLGDENPVSDFEFGGSNDAHDAGAMRFVRIEYAGRELSPDVEINGLTFGGVGNGTVIDHIQVTYGLDDAFEFFGGTVNASHLIAFAQADDGLDFDLGYTGRINKALVLADVNSEHTGNPPVNPDSNGIELDNDSDGSNKIPRTFPVISELSIIGVSQGTDADNYENGIHVRRNGNISLTNTTVTGYNTGINWQTPSLPSESIYVTPSNDIHGFDNPLLFDGASLNPGFFVTTSTSDPAITWGLNQPFFNDSGWSLAGATGAFRFESGWAMDTWTKYDNF